MIPSSLEQGEHWAETCARPAMLAELCAHVAQGGTLVTAAKAYDVPARVLAAWLEQDPDRKTPFEVALTARREYLIQRLLYEVQGIALVDPRELVGDDGKPLAFKDWPADLARAVQAVELDDEGRVTKVRFADKLRAAELLGRELGKFQRVDRVLHEHDLAGGLKRARERASRLVEVAPARIESEGGVGGDSAAATPHPPVSAQKIIISEKVPHAPPLGSESAATAAGAVPEPEEPEL